MRPIRSLITAVLVCGMTCSAMPDREKRQPIQDKPAADAAAQASNHFAFDIYRDLVGQAEASENIFFSPISVTAALSLTYEGARGNTQAQFEKVMHVKDAQDGFNRAAYHQSLSSVLGELDGKDKPYALSVANSLWGEQSMPFRPAFLQTLDTHYDAGFKAVDFRGAPNAQRKQINAWVQDQTQDRIKDLLPEGSITGLTRLVLANAIYFKGPWHYQFNSKLTEDRPFYRIAGQDDGASSEQVAVPTMRLPNERLRFADLDGLDVLEMPYKSGDLSMLVLLPDDRDGLAGLESQLSAKALDQWVSKLKSGPVQVNLPKWESTRSTDLVPTLKRLGLTDAFDDNKADFTGISDSADGERLSITGVFHKAFIKVDEQGSEAAAATAIVIGLTSAVPTKPFVFTADHPFVYLIRDNRTGAVLFMGRMADPS